MRMFLNRTGQIPPVIITVLRVHVLFFIAGMPLFDLIALICVMMRFRFLLPADKPFFIAPIAVLMLLQSAGRSFFH